jgi:hypothetical protein
MSDFNLTDQTNLFKINYYKKSENMYNSANVLQGRIKKKYDFTGKQRFVATPLSFSGGVGAGTLPVSNAGNYEGAVITSKKVYATCEVEREAIKASANDQGAFVRATAETVKKTVESYMRNSSRILFGDGTGILGKGVGAGPADVTGAGSTGSPYVVTFAAAQWNEANWEEKDLVQMVTSLASDNTGGTAEGGDSTTNLLEIVEVDPVALSISLVGTSAVLAALVSSTDPLPASTGIAMQRSYLKEPMGLDGALLKTSGTLYNIPIQRRWQALQSDANGAGITVDKMNSVMLQVEKKFGKAPNMIVASYEQYQNILALLEDQKRYNLPNKNLKGALSFSGVEFMATTGAVGIFVDRFAKKDKVYFLNDNFIECHHRPGFGWFDDDGTVFLRTSGDSYEARYGGYYENFITPTAHGILYDLAV